MNNKNFGLLITIVTIVFCGLPGLLIGVLSGIRLMANQSPETTPSLLSLAPLVVSLLLILIPVGVGIFSLRKRHNNESPQRFAE